MNEMMSPSNNCDRGDGERILSIPENKKNLSRTFTLYVQDDADRYHRCYVTQVGNGTEIDTEPITFTVSPTGINVKSLAATRKVQITSSTADGYTISTPFWITVGEKKDNYFTLSINANTSKFPRSGTVSVTASAAGKDNIVVSISVKQAATELEPIEPKPIGAKP